MKKLIKFVSLILVISIYLNFTVMSSTVTYADDTAEETPAVTLTAVADVSGSNTVNVSLEITAPEGVNVAGVQVELLYDTEYFSSGDDTDGDGAVTFLKENISGGTSDRYAAFSMTAAEAITTGYYYVHISSVLVYDDSIESRELPYEATDAEFVITGEDPEVLVTMSQAGLTLIAGATKTLSATVTPENILDKKVTWHSDNTRVATVSANGTVTAVSEGTANIYASCGEEAAVCVVTVYESSSSAVMFERSPYKLDYFVGEEVDTAGMKLRVFTDSKQSIIVDSGWTVTHAPFETEGIYTVTVDYCGCILNYSVNVNEPPQDNADSLTVYSLPENDVYKLSELYLGLYPRLYGLGFAGEDGIPRYFNPTASNVTMSLTSPKIKLGKNTVVITYDTFNFYVDFIVVANDAPDSIEVASLPVGAPVFGSKMTAENSWGLSVNAVTGDTKTLLDLNEITLPSGKFDRAGETIVELNYKGRLAYYTVNMEKPELEAAEGICIVSEPLKTVYKTGEKLSLTGLTVGALYNGCVFDTVTDYTVDPVELTTGKNTVTVRYGDFSITFTVTVLEELVVVPDTITSNIYTVKSGYITGVSDVTEVSVLIGNINEGDFITVMDENGNTLSDGDLVTTGAIAAIIDQNSGEQLAYATVIVSGDMNCDGYADSVDFELLKQYLLGTAILEANSMLAADVAADNTVDISDLVKLRDMLK